MKLIEKITQYEKTLQAFQKEVEKLENNSSHHMGTAFRMHSKQEAIPASSSELEHAKKSKPR